MGPRSWLAIAAVLIGAVDAVILKSFEWLVDHGTHDIWDEVFDTDVHRWAVVPLAVGLGIALSAAFVMTGHSRVVAPSTDALHTGDGDGPPPTLATIATIGLLGLGSLWAGASLGPEASLVGVAAGLGVWLAHRASHGREAKVLQLASIGALLVAFVGSMLLVVLPMLILHRSKQLNRSTALPIVLAGASSFGTLWLLDRDTRGFGRIPAEPRFTVADYAVAGALGIAATVLGRLLTLSISSAYSVTRRVDDMLPWPVSGALFGLVIGLLYWAGGESVQFSGSTGTDLLLRETPTLGLGGLCLVLIVKLLVTGWSLASGYRGGLVFPSVFVGVTITLVAGELFGSTSPGVMIGSIAGVLAALTGPAAALVLIAALAPLRLVGIAIVGIVGAVVGNSLWAHWRR